MATNYDITPENIFKFTEIISFKLLKHQQYTYSKKFKFRNRSDINQIVNCRFSLLNEENNLKCVQCWTN